MISIEDVIGTGELIEVGANYGDITQQLAEIQGLRIDALELKASSGLKERFSKTSHVNVLYADFFRLGKNADFHMRYDVVLFKEWFNAFGQERYLETIEIAEKILKSSGKIIIIDYFPQVLYRQFICSVVFRPWSVRNSYLKFKQQKTNRLLNEERLKDLIKLNDNLKREFNFYPNVDPLNSHDSVLHKILEFVFPCKFCAVLYKDQEQQQ